MALQVPQELLGHPERTAFLAYQECRANRAFLEQVEDLRLHRRQEEAEEEAVVVAVELLIFPIETTKFKWDVSVLNQLMRSNERLRLTHGTITVYSIKQTLKRGLREWSCEQQ